MESRRGTFSADKAIVTLPLGVLKKGLVRFDPPLPERKTAAIERLGMGTLDMVALAFPEPFWPHDHDFIAGYPAEGDIFPRFFDRFRKTGRPILVASVGGRGAEALESLSDGEVEAAAMRPLRRLFGGAIPSPVSMRRTAWASDPFTSGSYSHIPVGASPADYDALAEPVEDVLFFAGEATNREHPATVHGAYLSGLREAARLESSREPSHRKRFSPLSAHKK